MAGVSSIDKLPEKERQRIIKALTEAGPEPDYRGIVAKLKLGCSHSALWRYHHAKVIPALKRNTAAILAGSLPMDNANTEQDQCDTEARELTARREAQSVTRQSLVDDPIIAALAAKRSRMEQAIGETFEQKNYDAYTKLESVDLKAIEMHAKAIQHPGFSTAAPAQAGGTTVVVVMPTAASIQARRSRVIDVVGEGE